MDRRVTGLAALVLGAALALPGAGAAQEDLAGPSQTGGLGEITASLNAGPATDTAAGTDGNVNGPNGAIADLPGLGVLVPGADSTIGTAPGSASTITGAPETASAPGALAPTVTEETTDPLGSVLDAVEDGDDPSGEGRGNRGTAGADGTDAAVAGPAGSVPEESVEPAPDAEPAPAPTDEAAAGESAEAAPAEAAPAEPAPAEPATDACGYPTWYDAQLALEADASLAPTLDPDNDGIACEEAMY